jgi:hypothetical protein
MKLSVVHLAIKRLGYLISAVIIVALVPELLDESGFQWETVRTLAKAPLAYWLITVFRDFQDPTIPNLTPDPPKSEPTKIEVIDLTVRPDSDQLSMKG